jgi:hypothetical protein
MTSTGASGAAKSIVVAGTAAGCIVVIAVMHAMSG